MGFLKRFANSRVGAGSGDIILEEKDVPEDIKREKQALKFSREGYLDVGKSDLSVLSKPASQASSSNPSGGMFSFLDSSSSNNSSSSLSNDKNLRAISSRLEDNSNELYRLMQRIELLERKIERLENKNGSVSSDSPSDNSQPSGFSGGLPF